MLLFQSVRNNHQEELHNWLVRIFGRLLLLSAWSLSWNVNLNVVLEVRINGILEVFNLGSIMEGNNISVINENIEAILLRERIELVLEVFSVLDVLLEAEYSPLLEVDGLAHNLSKNVGVVEGLTCWLESTLTLGSGEHENAGSFEDLGLDLIGLEVDLELPLLHFLGVGYHAIQI